MRLIWNWCEFKLGKTIGFRIWIKTKNNYYQIKYSISFNGPYITIDNEESLPNIVNIDEL